jgi:type I restriction enzyme M protein
MSRVFRNIEGSAVGSPSELDIKGLFDDMDVNSNKIGGTVTKRNELLVKLLESVGELQLGNYADNSIDAFGDAYEYLMTMYASSAGKSGGEFFTPQEVSELLAKITVVGKKKVNKVYDPACGSGSLLLQFAKVLGKDNVTDGFYGQEINITTFNLCRINMFLHDINYEKFDIAHGDTLTEPTHWDDQPFEAIVSNPPYIAEGDPHLQALHSEPRQALVSGVDGLDDIRHIIEQAPHHLTAGAWLLLEHGFDQASAVQDLLRQTGFAQVQSRVDLAGIKRCSGGQWPEVK